MRLAATINLKKTQRNLLINPTVNDNKIIIAISAITLVLLIGTVLLASKMSNSAKVSANNGATAEVNNTSYDWGTIGINNGKVEAWFEIKSVGSKTLKLFNSTTSCACTSAQVFVDDKTSPLIGMHTKSTYVSEVPPGKTAKVKVIYDPLFHGPNGIGSIDRQVTLETNDPQRPSIIFFVKAQVIK